MGPNFKFGELYSLLNGKDGELLRLDLPNRKIHIDNPESDPDADEAFQLLKVSKSPLTIKLSAAGGPENLILEHHKDGAKLWFAPSPVPKTGSDEWIVEHEGSDIYSNFFKLKNVYSGTFLDISHADDETAVGKKINHHSTQYWQFIHVQDEDNQDAGTVHTPKRKKHIRDKLRNHQDTFRKDKAKYLKEKQAEAAQEQYNSGGNQPAYTGPNICGNPMCGVDHICAADYNRIVRPMGYPGVPGI